MLAIDENIVTIDSKICSYLDNIDSESRGEISQDILAQLIYIAEQIMLKFYSGGRDIDDTDENVAEAMEFSQTNDELKTLYRFRNYLQIVAAHSTLDANASERLMLKYCTTDGSEYINNLGSSGMTFNKVYAFNGYKVHATTTTGYIGQNSQTAAEGYGCYVDLTSGSYSYLVGNNLSTSAIGDTAIRGYVNLRNPGERDQYAIIDIVDSHHNIKQTFVQEINNN